MNEIATFERWRDRGSSLARKLDFDPGLINEALSVVGNTVGITWLADATVEEDLGTPLPRRPHRLGRLIATASEKDVVELLELAEYLKAIAASGQDVSTIANGLRAAYGSTLLQIAFFYRLSRAGARNVRLEPEVEEGRFGDILFDSNSTRSVVECYRPAPSSRDLGEIEWIATQALDRVLASDFPVSVCIDLRSVPTAADRKAIVSIVEALRRQHEANESAGSQNNRTLLHEGPAALISVGRAPIRAEHGPHELVRHPAFRDDRPDLFHGARHAPKSKVFSVQDPRWEGPSLGSVAVWFPENLPASSQESPLLRLLPYLKKKLAQTKQQGAGRWLVVEHRFAGHFHNAPDDERDALKQRLFEEHRGVNGMLIVRRVFDRGVGRYRYVHEMFRRHDEIADHMAQLPTLESSLTIPSSSSAGARTG